MTAVKLCAKHLTVLAVKIHQRGKILKPLLKCFFKTKLFLFQMRYFTHFYTVNILWVLFGCTNPTEIDIESYKEVIAKSLKFYKAQRSGRLPDNDIPWRSHSALNDRGQNGEDLSGGYYDGSRNLF